MSDQLVTQAATYPTHNKHNRRTYIPSTGFEATIPAIKRPQTYALEWRGLMIVLSPSRHTRRVPQLRHDRFPPYSFCFTTDHSFHHRRQTAWDTASVVKQTTLSPRSRNQEDDCCGRGRDRGMKREHVTCWGCNTYVNTWCAEDATHTNQPTKWKKFFLKILETVNQSKKNSPIFMKPQSFVLTSSLQHATIISRINPVHSSHFISFRFIITFSPNPLLTSGSQAVSFCQNSSSKLCTHFSSPQCVKPSFLFWALW